jgi:hypothetical protein
MDTRICHKCLVEQPLEEFPWKNIVTRKRQAVCKTCNAKRSAEWYARNREHHIENVYGHTKQRREDARDFILRYISNHPCEVCGETDPLVLEFHHVSGKEETVSILIHRGHSIERIMEELSRCKVLCCNCHRRITISERGWYRGKR